MTVTNMPAARKPLHLIVRRRSARPRSPAATRTCATNREKFSTPSRIRLRQCHCRRRRLSFRNQLQKNTNLAIRRLSCNGKRHRVGEYHHSGHPPHVPLPRAGCWSCPGHPQHVTEGAKDDARAWPAWLKSPCRYSPAGVIRKPDTLGRAAKSRQAAKADRCHAAQWMRLPPQTSISVQGRVVICAIAST